MEQLEQAIEALNQDGIFWFGGYRTQGHKLHHDVEEAGVDCYYAEVGPEFENVLFQFERFSHREVENIAVRRIQARENKRPLPNY